MKSLGVLACVAVFVALFPHAGLAQEKTRGTDGPCTSETPENCKSASGSGKAKAPAREYGSFEAVDKAQQETDERIRASKQETDALLERVRASNPAPLPVDDDEEEDSDDP